MFGWEFPPHISGGLGTACFGLTKALAGMKDIELKFVVPKIWGDEDLPNIKLLDAGEVPVAINQIQFADIDSKVEYYKVQSGMIPYLGTSEFCELKSKVSSGEDRLVEINGDGRFIFRGNYDENLFQEVKNYALVAESIALENDFDVIHVHDWMTFPAGISAKRVSGKPLVAHVHSTEFDRCGKSVNPLICSIERDGLLGADKIIAVSNLTRNILIANYGIDPSKIVIVYNAVEPYDYDEIPKIANESQDKIVSFLGRITEQKGPEYFIEAARCVLRKKKDVQFYMAGKGNLLNDMITRVVNLNISEYFHFPGFLDDKRVNELFQMTDVFVMSSVSEPFGIVSLEASQAGVPVILTKQSGVAEILQSAVKVDYWDVQAMADAILSILDDSEYRNKLSELGLKETTLLLWRDAAFEVSKVYFSLLKLAI